MVPILHLIQLQDYTQYDKGLQHRFPANDAVSFFLFEFPVFTRRNTLNVNIHRTVHVHLQVASVANGVAVERVSCQKTVRIV